MELSMYETEIQRMGLGTRLDKCSIVGAKLYKAKTELLYYRMHDSYHNYIEIQLGEYLLIITYRSIINSGENSLIGRTLTVTAAVEERVRETLSETVIVKVNVDRCS